MVETIPGADTSTCRTSTGADTSACRIYIDRKIYGQVRRFL